MSLLLVVVLVLGLLPLTAFAQPAPEAIAVQTGTIGAGGAPWTLYDDGTVVVGDGRIAWVDGLVFNPWYRVDQTAITSIQFTGSNAFGIQLNSIFRGLSNLVRIEGLENWDVSNTVNLEGTFAGASSLRELDVSGWDVSSVGSMTQTFAGASSLTELDISGWDVSRVQSMRGTFSGASSLTELDVSSWNVSGVWNMSGMFADTSSLARLDVSGWDVSSVWDMSLMFYEASSLSELDVSGWDVSSVTDMHAMFHGASSLAELDLSAWDVSSVWDMWGMFEGMSSLRELTLGESFYFVGDLNDIGLPNPPSTSLYTGYWQNVGSGTAANPQGDYILTALELMEHHNENQTLETWVWQRVPQPTVAVGAQVGTMTARTAGTVTFPVTVTHIADGDYTVAVANLPTGVTVYGQVTIADGAGILTLAGDATTLAGVTNTLVLTLDDTASAPFTLTIRAQSSGSGPTPPPPPPPPPPAPERQAFLIGMPDGTARPNANITRAEVATIFFRLIADDTRTANWTQENPFDDVELQRWFNNAISTTTNMGLFQGVGDDLFAPNRSITRGELAAVLVRFAGVDTGLFSASEQFSDIAGHWAQSYINEAARQGWILGYADGTFRPNQPVTRAETAAMVCRIFERLIYSVDDLLPDRVRFSDLTNQNAWFYLYMASATNSFTYRRANADDIFLTWIEIIEPRDWRVLERPESRPGDILR